MRRKRNEAYQDEEEAGGTDSAMGPQTDALSRASGTSGITGSEPASRPKIRWDPAEVDTSSGCVNQVIAITVTILANT